MVERTLQFDNRKNIFWVAITVIGVCACMYIYFITSAVRNVVIEKNLAMQTSNLSEQLSSKEFAAINLKSNVTMQYAQSLGFSEAKNKVFITPTSVSLVSSDTSDNNAI